MSKNIKNNVAYVINCINEISGKRPGKKVLQKIVFLIQEKGVDLNFEYGLHFYGPYSGGLDGETTFLNADGIIKLDCSGYSHLMSINDEVFYIESNNLTDKQKETICGLIYHFKDRTPAELELLTTALYAYNHLQNKTEDSIISGVQKIKGSKYSINQIRESLKEFSYFNKTLTKNN
ncbi:MAG: hypothetical protein M0P77_04675 [Firmicutes bacterium]|nr:hypothetical protein [Bacillota bacterium]